MFTRKRKEKKKIKKLPPFVVDRQRSKRYVDKRERERGRDQRCANVLKEKVERRDGECGDARRGEKSIGRDLKELSERRG